ncbi:MAG: GtrA family protein [Muribaculaceae bacterium]|nr:GtrA family protein [Muribaculaceae bacterium]
MKIDKAELQKTCIQLLKYGAIGVMNTLITLVSFYLLNTWAGISYGISNIVGYVLGVVNSFLWNRNWVFKTSNNLGREALLFGCGFLLCWILQGIVSLVLLEGFMWKNLPSDIIPFLPMENAGQNIVMVVSMVVYTVANYAYNRMVTFKESQDSRIENQEPSDA